MDTLYYRVIVHTNIIGHINKVNDEKCIWIAIVEFDTKK